MDIVAQADGTLMCVHGNPNMLTLDKGTSKLAQGPTAHSCLVEIERFVGDLPIVTAFTPPKVEDIANVAYGAELVCLCRKIEGNTRHLKMG